MPPEDHDLPRCWGVSRLVGRVLLRLAGWRLEGRPPAGVPRAVLVAAPHTSNWDYVYALLAGWSWGLSFQWLGKDSLFRSPLGWLLRLLGGIGVDRSAPHGLVGQVADRIRAADRILLMVPAEGTRSYTPYWKSGFLHIAKEAGVPVILGYLDFGRKVAGLGPLLVPSEDVRADMDVVRSVYRDTVACHPELKSRIRLKGEDEPPAEASPRP